MAVSMPKSSKNEKVTGPAMGMRYSALVVRLGVAADGGHAVDRQRHLDALVQLRIGRIARNASAVRIGQLHVDAGGNVAVRRGAADIEAAQLALAAGVEAVVGRGHIAAKPCT